ncbi:hypothetical protein B0H13DRAFT_1909378 [Mycena leptocephala]|nr:hypothetical protein B0H13DRAFT_1909378 [Mycena leptocephala]
MQRMMCDWMIEGMDCSYWGLQEVDMGTGFVPWVWMNRHKYRRRSRDVGTRQDVVQRLNQFSFGHKVEKQQSNHECKSHQPFQNRKQSWAISLPALPYTPPLPTASSNVKSTSLAHPAPAPAHTTYVSPSPLKARRAKATRVDGFRTACPAGIVSYSPMRSMRIPHMRLPPADSSSTTNAAI